MAGHADLVQAEFGKRIGEHVCVVHAKGLAELDPRAPVTSIDGVSAFDHISRGAMMTGLLRVEGGTAICGHVSTFRIPLGGFVWHSAQDPSR